MSNLLGTQLSLDPALYDPTPVGPSLDTFSACLNARGMYESQRFALRLNPVVHGLVDSVVAKAEKGDTSFTGEELQAYSTYVHETVHWWQHKGSTSGFIRSVLYPIQTHSNISDLRQIVSALGPQKPIQHLALQGELGLLPLASEEIGLLANTVTNNFMDTEFYLALTLKPTLDLEIYKNPYFEAAGHSFLITYALVIGALRELVDPHGTLFPEPQTLVDNLTQLAKQKVTGYYYGSGIFRAPVGLLDLYEGQARFIQLQFLALASGGLSTADARDGGLLDGVYGKAFQEFLKLSESPDPENLESPLIALFLFICDMSINPTVGFPGAIDDYETFFLDADPGIRFAKLCRAVATDAQELRTYVKEYCTEEYFSLAQKLGALTGLGNHLTDLARLARHAIDNPDAANLMKEHAAFKFSPRDIALRLLTGEFLSFIGDKHKSPEFFCWAGYWLTRGSSDKQKELWLRHLSLFSDKADDGALFARKNPDRNEDDILEVFNQFFAAVLLYDLTKQWVLNPGPFRHEYSWLTSSAGDPKFLNRVKDVFSMHYGVDVDQFKMIDRPVIPKMKK